MKLFLRSVKQKGEKLVLVLTPWNFEKNQLIRIVNLVKATDLKQNYSTFLKMMLKIIENEKLNFTFNVC